MPTAVKACPANAGVFSVRLRQLAEAETNGGEYNDLMKVDKSKLKVTGMVAAVIAVVGITFIIGKSSITSELTKGVSADIGDIAAGEVVLIPTDDYNSVLAKLDEYFIRAGDEVTRDTLITEAVNILEGIQKQR